MGLSISISDTCDKCNHTTEHLWRTVTHNLTDMADYVGLYEAMWHPERLGLVRAGQLTSYLVEGIQAMIEKQVEARQLSPKNGWGTYDEFMALLEELLIVCQEHPDSYYNTYP